MSTDDAAHTSSSPSGRRRSPRRLRWAVPVAAAALVVGGTLAANNASADPALPEKSAEELLTAVASAEVDGLTGTVQQQAELGLPSLPSGSEHGDGGDLADLASGSHTLRVWAAGEDRAKVDMHTEYGQASVIHNDDETWMYDHADSEAVHTTYTGEPPEHPESDQVPKTPQEAAERALDAIDDSTEVSVARNVEVAGRAAYELVLTPTDDRSLVDEVTIAVDGETSVPLRVQVQAEGQPDPAFSVGFTEIDFSVPSDDVFEFTPPPGTDVTEHTVDADDFDHGEKGAGDAPTIVGDGWTSVAVLDEAPTGKQAGPTLQALPKVSGSWGSGRLLSGTLFSAVITDDGRTAVGAVEPELLYRALDK
jgi:outer membrane lipoprotein-sorting protein